MIPKIVAIGGGQVFPSQVTAISREIIRLSGKKHPRLLFIPTASLDDEGYVRKIQRHFGRQLGCQVDTLYLIKENPSFSLIRRKIFSSDIIYVGGGNTLRMIHCWKRRGVDQVLKQAGNRGKILCGTSAGAICWFRQGNSDSRKFKNPKAGFIKVTGLGLIEALGCPHYDAEKDRKPGLRKMMKKMEGVAIAMDNGAALEIVGQKYRALRSQAKAGVYRVYWSKGIYYQNPISRQHWQPLSQLGSK